MILLGEFMRKILLLIACALCLFLCACTPNNDGAADTTPAPTEPKPTPGMTVIAPTGTPGEYIDVIDPSESPVVVPIEPPVPSTDGTPDPTPNGTPDPTPNGTPAPTPDATAKSTSNGIDLPYIPVRPL